MWQTGPAHIDNAQPDKSDIRAGERQRRTSRQSQQVVEREDRSKFKGVARDRKRYSETEKGIERDRERHTRTEREKETDRQTKTLVGRYNIIVQGWNIYSTPKYSVSLSVCLSLSYPSHGTRIYYLIQRTEEEE